MLTGHDHLCSDKHLWRCILTYLWYAWTYFNETYHSYFLPHLHDTDDIFEVLVQRSRSRTTFSKSALFWRRHTDRQFAMEDHPVDWLIGNSYKCSRDVECHICISDTRSTQWEDPRLQKLGGPVQCYLLDYPIAVCVLPVNCSFTHLIHTGMSCSVVSCWDSLYSMHQMSFSHYYSLFGFLILTGFFSQLDYSGYLSIFDSTLNLLSHLVCTGSEVFAWLQEKIRLLPIEAEKTGLCLLVYWYRSLI